MNTMRRRRKMAMALLVVAACVLTVAHAEVPTDADGSKAGTAAHAAKEAEGGARGPAGG